MYTAADLRKGLRVEVDGVPYAITEFNFVKPGKGQAIYTCRLKNMITGLTMTKAYRSNDTFDEPKLDERNLTFTYAEGDDYIFLDRSFEQFVVKADVLGDSRYFLKEDIEVAVLFHNSRPIGITLPTYVEKRITHTDPGARGNTATNVTKPATVEGGYQLQVPLFVNEGEVITIDTRTGEYGERVRQK